MANGDVLAMPNPWHRQHITIRHSSLVGHKTSLPRHIICKAVTFHHTMLEKPTPFVHPRNAISFRASPSDPVSQAY